MSWLAESVSFTYIYVWLMETFEEEEVVLDAWVVVELLQGQVHSFSVGFRKLIVRLLSFSAAEDANCQQQDSHD